MGIEASGQSQWFERMLAELGHEVWIGDAAKIRASCERKQKTDRRDAKLLLRLLAEDRFPRIWVPTAAERDARQLLLHRHKLVRMRTQVKNQLQALALNQGVQRKKKLWSEAGRKQLESLPLLPWASRRRAELLQLLDQLEASIGELDRAVAEQAHGRPARTSRGFRMVSDLGAAHTMRWRCACPQRVSRRDRYSGSSISRESLR